MIGAAPQARETGAGQGLAAAVAHFAALLREVGLRVGTGQTIDAVRALALVDTTQRDPGATQGTVGRLRASGAGWVQRGGSRSGGAVAPVADRRSRGGED